jgi:hypothetical protein
MTKRVPLPEPVARIYKATAALEALYPSRKQERSLMKLFLGIVFFA